jgi:glycosyltransferase involved in cell wall biosynthesis
MVAPEYPPLTGGMSTHAAESAARLARRGHQVTVITSAGGGTAAAGVIRAEPLLDRRFGRALRWLARRARETRADAILLMNAGYAPLALRRGDALPPILARTVGNDVYGAWHGPRLPLRFLFWRLPHRHPGSLGARLRRLDQARRVAAVLSGLGRCDAVLCNSGYTRDRLQGLGIDASRLGLLVGGVDADRFRPDPTRPLHPDGPVLGTAGRLKPIKGFDVALEAAARLRALGLKPRLVIAGSGPEERRLRERGAGLGLGEALEFLGDQPATTMPAFYRRLDFYLQPSVAVRHEATGLAQEESMGRAILEAQASGVPVVASRTGGIPDVVEDGETGVLVPPGDARRLAEAIAELAVDTERRRRLAATARRTVEERFSWDAVVGATEAAIASVLRARARTGS